MELSIDGFYQTRVQFSGYKALGIMQISLHSQSELWVHVFLQ